MGSLPSSPEPRPLGHLQSDPRLGEMLNPGDVASIEDWGHADLGTLALGDDVLGLDTDPPAVA